MPKIAKEKVPLAPVSPGGSMPLVMAVPPSAKGKQSLDLPPTPESVSPPVVSFGKRRKNQRRSQLVGSEPLFLPDNAPMGLQPKGESVLPPKRVRVLREACALLIDKTKYQAPKEKGVLSTPEIRSKFEKRTVKTPKYVVMVQF